MELINELIPDFVWQVDMVANYQEQIAKLAQYIQDKGYPRLSGASRKPEEAEMGSLVHNLKQIKKRTITKYA